MTGSVSSRRGAPRRAPARGLRRILGVCLLVGHGAVPAQEAPVELDPVTVEDSERGRSVAEADLSAYTGFGKRIDRSAFEARFVQMSELLDRLPGLQVTSAGGTGSFDTVSVRGASGRQVSLFVDGLLLNSPDSGYAGFNQLPAILIDQIEVYPDFTPAPLGNANLAGAINFVTRAVTPGERGGELRGSYGSFDTRNAEASAWGAIGDWSLMGALNRTRADNDFPVDADLFATTGDTRRNDGYAQDALFVKLAREGAALHTRALLQYADSDKELPTALNQLRDDASLATEALRTQALFDHALGDFELGHRLYYARQTEIYDDRSDSVGLSADWVETDLDSYGLFSAASRRFARHRIVLGLELRQDEFAQDDRLERSALVDAERLSAILALSDEWTPRAHWRLNATARFYHVDDRIDIVARDEDASADLSEPSVQFGARWQALPWLAWKANAGLLIRVPTLTEKFGAQGLFEGDPHLRHEEALSADTGVDFAYGAVSATASLFVRELSDGIVTIYDSRGVGQPQNLGESLLGGLEAELDWAPLSWLDLRLQGTLLDSENRSNISSANGRKLPGIYHRSYGAGFTVHGALAQFAFDWQHSGELYYDSANGVRADDKDQLSASLTLRWQRYSFDLTGRNLLDENFLDLNRFPTPGRSLTATLSVTFS